MTSIAPRRAASRRVPSWVSASELIAPPRVMAPGTSRVVRSRTATRLPAATYARAPSGDAATARVGAPTFTRATTLFEGTSVRTTSFVPVAMTIARALAAGAVASAAAAAASSVVSVARSMPSRELAAAPEVARAGRGIRAAPEVAARRRRGGVGCGAAARVAAGGGGAASGAARAARRGFGRRVGGAVGRNPGYS